MGNKIPLYGPKDWFALENLSYLEDFIAPDFTCATDSVQTAIQSCLELLGARAAPIPVILPVTSAPDTLSAVLRSGAHPLLLDIEEETLQMDPEQLKEAIELVSKEEQVPVVLFNRPFGLPIRPELLEQVLDLPSICDSRVVPHKDLGLDDMQCAFNVFDLAPLCGGGAAIIHPFPAQVKHLKAVRSGVMGLSGALSETQAEMASGKLLSYEHDINVYREVVNQLMSYGLETMTPAQWPAPLWVKVSNAKRTVAHLLSYGIQAVVSLCPLHILDEVKRRYVEEPEYPVAAELQNRFICIPTHEGVKGREEEIAKRIKEIL